MEEDDTFEEFAENVPSIYPENTIEDVEELFALHFPDHTLGKGHFKEALRYICADENCDKKDLQFVLLELRRRIKVKEEAFWDFQLLDVMQQGRIPVSKAEYLFKLVHGLGYERFWEAYLEGKIIPDEDVTFEEIEMFLCSIL